MAGRAENNDPFAQCILGILYERGLFGVSQNFTEATTWFESAAELDEPEAQYRMGELYKYGSVSRKGLKGWMIALRLWGDLTSGSFWYERAAQRVHVFAQYNIGLLYAGLHPTEHIPKNIAKARHWLNLAANQGLEKA